MFDNRDRDGTRPLNPANTVTETLTIKVKGNKPFQAGEENHGWIEPDVQSTHCVYDIRTASTSGLKTGTEISADFSLTKELPRKAAPTP